jgi:hypothetical protein
MPDRWRQNPDGEVDSGTGRDVEGVVARKAEEAINGRGDPFGAHELVTPRELAMFTAQTGRVGVKIPAEAFATIPYLDAANLGDRTVNLMPLWDGERWRQWFWIGHQFIEVKIVDTIESDYVAKSPAKESDRFIPFVHVMWQQMSWPEILPKILAILADFRNMGISIAKLRFFFDHDPEHRSLAISRFAETETEYLLMLTRSVFDLLQEAISRVWATRVKLHDPDAEARRHRRRLPETFSKIVLHEKQTVRSAADIANEFGLPDLLANQYADIAPFFCRLRAARDAIVHGGADTGHIFNTERGFCVDPRCKPFTSFSAWTDAHRYNENLVSILPWLAEMIVLTIGTCDRLMQAFASVIQLPPQIAPGYAVFVRGPQNEALEEVLRIHKNGDPWWQSRINSHIGS